MSKCLGDVANDILGRYGVSDEEGNIQAFPSHRFNESQTPSHAPPSHTPPTPSVPQSNAIGGTPVHEAMPPMEDTMRNRLIRNSLIAEGKMSDLEPRKATRKHSKLLII